jgi:integrase
LASVLDRLSARPIGSISATDIADIVATSSRETPIHANRSLAYIRACYAWAVGLGLTDHNPARTIPAPVVETPRARAPTLEEIAEMWNAAGGMDYPFGPAIRLLILTAWPREEVAALQVEDLVQGPRGPLLRRLNHRTSDRLAAGGFLPISDAAREELDMAVSRLQTGSLYVFSGTGKTPISGWSKAKRRLDDLVQSDRVRRSGTGTAPMPAWRFSDLRRSFAEIVADRLKVYTTVIECCLGRTSKITSELERDWAASEHMLDEMATTLESWAALVQNAASGRSA